MSYDLRLSGPNIEDFKHLMARVAHVQPNGDDGWVYVNEPTGVYFTSAIDEVIDDEEAYEHGYPRGRYVECSLNYLRPTFFVDESVPVILGYASALGWTVYDPQLSGAAQAPATVDVDAVRRKWTDVTRSMLGDYAGPRMSSDASAAMWRHNVALDDRGEGELFVPTLLAARRRDDPSRALRLIVWGEDVGTVFPPADIVAVVSHRKVGPLKVGKPRTTVVPFDAFIAGIEPYALRRGDDVLLAIDRTREAATAVRALPGVDIAQVEVLATDEFVDLDANATATDRG